MKVSLNAKCGNCGYNQVLNGFEDILSVNKNKKMGILYDGFLLVAKCRKCKSDYCYRCECKCGNMVH